MVAFGIFTKKQFLALGEERWRAGPHVAYNLLEVGDSPSPDDIRVFESLSFVLRMSNDTFRTTFRNRFPDVDQAALLWMQESFAADAPLRVEDRAVSTGLTAAEWAVKLGPCFPNLRFEASDLVMQLLELTLDNGAIYITEVDGTPLQYIRSPFVVPVHHPDARRYPVNRWIASRAKKRFQALHLPENWPATTSGPNYRVRPISFVHPEARALLRGSQNEQGTQKETGTPHFEFKIRSVFEQTPQPCHVVRTMNILNRDYFSESQLAAASSSIFHSLEPGGLWILGRTLEENHTNHTTIFRRGDKWECLQRLGNGSEVEQLMLQAPLHPA